MAGGGFKAVGYLGLLDGLWPELCLELRGICGVSAGAAIGLLLAVGFTPWEVQQRLLAVAWPPVLREVLRDLPVERLLGGHPCALGAPCTAAPMRRLLQTWLSEKHVPPGATFEWLAARDPAAPAFACVVACLETGALRQLDAVSAPQCSLLRAVLASAAVPFVFPAVRVLGELCVDAGVVNNAPISVVRRAWPQWPRLLVLTPHAFSGMPESPWGVVLWHRACFLAHAEVCRCRALDTWVIQLPPAPADVHLFCPGASLPTLFWQGKLALLCWRQRSLVAGLLILVVARLLRPRCRATRLRKRSTP